jgi:subtilisin family serine protease/N-acetylneuraminic acid mutarotase
MRRSLAQAALAALLVAAPLSGVAVADDKPAPPTKAETPRSPTAKPNANGKLRDPVKVDRAAEQRTAGGRKTDLWVHFRAEADLSGAANLADWAKRGQDVVDKLRATANSSQASVAKQLASRNARYESFWAVNAILVRGGDSRLLDILQQQADVKEIRAHQTYQLPEPAAGTDAADGPVEWGIENINADDVWNQFGVRGENIVVANIDSGVQYDHPALVRQYRGNNGDGTFSHDYNWYDPAGVCGDVDAPPCDNNGHGSHTMGTMVGDDGGTNHIGVAPNARWIAAKGCEEDWCSEFALLSAGQWVLAPTDHNGTNPDPARRPQVVNNSWGGGDGSDLWYRELVDAWVAAGIFPAFANGNSGYGVCGTVGAPGSYAASYGVGAYDVNDEIANFSSLGPSGADGGIKPDAAAPGVDVRSSVPGSGYSSFSGTSMATPHLAGTVALMLSAAPALLGDVATTKALLDATARDTADSAHCGGTLADNNTFGEGRIDALAAVDAAPRGDVAAVSGTVTDAASGAPVGGADLVVSGGIVDRRVRTDGAGRYRLTMSAGTYTLTASAYGYDPKSATVALAPGEDGRADLALTPRARSVLRGKVVDGSGHGWPLYARIDIDGYPGGPVYTDPVTGAYSVELAQETTYRLEVTATVDGYGTGTRTLELPADPGTQDFALVATAPCDTPGYEFGVRGLFETFDTTSAPAGWQVVDRIGSGQTWVFEDVAGRLNRTGGSGGFAIVDSDAGGGRQDTELVTATVDLSGIPAPVIRFNHDLNAYVDEAFDVDLSVDGGTTWTNVWRQRGGDFGEGDLRGPRVEEIPIPAAAGKAEVKARFHYYDADYANWWEIDDVLLGQTACKPIAGGLVVGNVTDGRTNAPLNGVVVSGGSADVTTGPTPGDGNLTDGFFSAFAPGSGTRTFTGTKQLYGPTPRTIDVVADGVVRMDVAMRSGHVTVGPAVDATVPMGGTSEAKLTITNDGTADARVELTSRAGDTRAAASNAKASAAVRRVAVAPSPARLPQGTSASTATAAAVPSQAPWQAIGDYPVRVTDNVAATLGGQVYSVGGFSPDLGPLDDLFIYDPGAGTWRRGRDMDDLHQKPAAAAVGDKLYVVGGFDDYVWSNRNAKRGMEIYDPATDTWTGGPDAPYGSAAAGIAVLDGKLYLVGGCGDSHCNQVTDVARFDPATNAWQSLAEYPEPAAWLSCAGDDLRKKVYCAGGVFSDGLTSAYAYDPAQNTWTPIASLPIPLWGSAYATANGQLAISGGVTGGQATNEGFVYDPFADAWDPLPPSNTVTYRGAGACGLYRIGGTAGSPSVAAEVLPGYGHCVPGEVPWLGLGSRTVTVPAGQSVTVDVTLDAAEAKVDQPGTHTAVIVVGEDTPSSVTPVPVSLDVTPPPTWGKLTGTLTALGRCDTGGSPMRGATVEVDGTAKDVRLAADGSYAVWMAEGNGPVSVAVGKAGYVRQVRRDVGIAAGATTTENFALRLDHGCATAAPSGVDVAVVEGERASVDVALGNAGGGSYDFTTAELPFLFEPVSGGPKRVAGTGWFGGASVPGGATRYAHAQCDGDVGQFYVLGGVDASRAPRDTAWRYNVATNTWTELAAVPAKLDSPTAVCELGRVHLLGGSGTNAHYLYDIASNTWTTAAELPRTVRGAASAVWDGKIYLVGGDADLVAGGTVGTVDVYDLATDRWTGTAAAMPVPALAAGAVQAGRFLYLVGGWHDGSPETNVTAVQRLDLATGTWSTGPAFGAGAADLAVAATDSAIYAIGGDRPGGGFADGSDEVFRLDVRSWPAGTWTADDRLPLRMSGNSAGFCSVGFLGGEIWSVGGTDQYRQGTGSAYLHDVGAERCATKRTDVPWLQVTPASGAVAADGSTSLAVTVDATGLPVGSYEATVLVSTTDSGAPELRVPVRVTVRAAPPAHLLALAGSGQVGGIGYADEDVLAITASGQVSRLFDGSDVGLGSFAVDAFARLDDGSLVLSFTQPGKVPGLADKVDDSDLVRFVPSSLGDTTTGRFEPWFDGSDVGLTSDGEDVDAVEVLADKRVVLSTEGSASVPLTTADDSDLLVFTPSSLGAKTAGRFALWLDGGDVSLSSDEEDVDAVAVRSDGVIGLSTVGRLAVPGLVAADEDVVAFTPTRLGPDTRGTFQPTRLFDGSALGVVSSDVTAYDVG